MSTGGYGDTRGAASGAPRVRLRMVSERPAGVDERLAVIFRDMRWALSLTKPELARKLRTSERVLSAMELGRIRELPAWPETVRIVTELGRLNRVDARPILARIRDQVGPAGLGQVPVRESGAQTNRSGRRPPQVRAGGSSVRSSDASDKSRVRVRVRADRAAKAVSALSAPAILAAGLFWMAQAQPGIVVSSVLALPEPIARVVRPLADALILRLAPSRDGLRWVEVADPRLRKSDKLRQASR